MDVQQFDDSTMKQLQVDFVETRKEHQQVIIDAANYTVNLLAKHNLIRGRKVKDVLQAIEAGMIYLILKEHGKFPENKELTNNEDDGTNTSDNGK